jgi:hypothetical protein
VHRSEDEAPSFAFGLGLGVGDPVDLQAIGIQQADQPTAVAQGDRCPEQDPEAVPGRQLTGVQDEPALVTVKDGPAVRSTASGVTLRRVTVSASGAGPTGLTRAATIRTVWSGAPGCPGWGVGIAWPVWSSVGQAWDWKARKIATHWSWAG